MYANVYVHVLNALCSCKISTYKVSSLTLSKFAYYITNLLIKQKCNPLQLLLHTCLNQSLLFHSVGSLYFQTVDPSPDSYTMVWTSQHRFWIFLLYDQSVNKTKQNWQSLDCCPQCPVKRYVTWIYAILNLSIPNSGQSAENSQKLPIANNLWLPVVFLQNDRSEGSTKTRNPESGKRNEITETEYGIRERRFQVIHLKKKY